MMVFRRLIKMFTALFAGAAISGSAQAQSLDLTEAEAIRAAYEVSMTPEKLFSKQFLAAVPVAQIKAISAQFLAEYGPIDTIDGDEGEYVLSTASHQMDVKVQLDENGQIGSLLFASAEALTASLTETLKVLEASADEVSYVLTRNGKPIQQLHTDKPLAVGSAFKLGVLKVIVDDIAAGKASWREVYELKAEDKSLPSGELQHFPDDAPFTLHSLASVMIAISDNTATDALMRIFGAERAAKALGIDVAFTTKQLFAFKHDAALREKYEKASAAEKRKILADIQAKPLPKPIKLGHHNQGFEWYVSVEHLCSLLEQLGPLDLFEINAGPLNAKDWDSVRFKGGSEPGVLNLSALATKDGKQNCMAITLNHSSEIEHDKIAGLFKRAMRQLAEEG